MQNVNSIDALVEDVLNGNYPFTDDDSLNTDAFEGWDYKLDNPFFYLDKLSQSNSYVALYLVNWAIEFMSPAFLKSHNKEFIQIFKQLLAHDSCTNIQYHIVLGIGRLTIDKQFCLFYSKILEDSREVVQNEAIFLLKYFNDKEIKLLDEMAEEDWFKSFFINYKDDINLAAHKDFLSAKSDVYKKIYLTGLYKKGYKSAELFKLVDPADYGSLNYIHCNLYELRIS